jgi:hypothetical protein
MGRLKMYNFDELQELLEETLLNYLEEQGIDDGGVTADELFIDIFKKYRR